MKASSFFKPDVLTVQTARTFVRCFSNDNCFFSKRFESREKAIEFAQNFAKRHQARILDNGGK